MADIGEAREVLQAWHDDIFDESLPDPGLLKVLLDHDAEMTRQVELLSVENRGLLEADQRREGTL